MLDENGHRVIYSPFERELLLLLVSKHSAIIDSKEINKVMSLKKQEAFQEIANEFNSTYGVTKRNPLQLRQCYSNLKKRFIKAAEKKKEEMGRNVGSALIGGQNNLQENMVTIGVIMSNIGVLNDSHNSNIAIAPLIPKQEIVVEDQTMQIPSTSLSSAPNVPALQIEAPTAQSEAGPSIVQFRSIAPVPSAHSSTQTTFNEWTAKYDQMMQQTKNVNAEHELRMALLQKQILAQEKQIELHDRQIAVHDKILDVLTNNPSSLNLLLK